MNVDEASASVAVEITAHYHPKGFCENREAENSLELARHVSVVDATRMLARQST